MNNFVPYNDHEIDQLTHEVWEVSDQPYMLHAAYALNSLHDCCTPELNEDDEEEEVNVDSIWGMKVAKKILDRLVVDVATDFNDAASNYKPIKIWGKTYSIRKVASYDHNRLHLIFDFPLKDGEYTISRTGIMNLGCDKSFQSKTVTTEQSQLNRSYLRKIIKLAEDDANNGWDKLTDMEVVIYCWALYYNKSQSNNLKEFQHKYRDFLEGISMADMLYCFNEKAAFRGSPIGMYTFSYEKVNSWNQKNRQISVAKGIPDTEADDYWYDIALKSTFKPRDF